MVNYPFFIGNDNQQEITKPNDGIYAWCQVSPMSLTPSNNDIFQIVMVEATLVENSLTGKKLSNPNQVAINWINPLNGMKRYEIIPYNSTRFNIQSIPQQPFVYEDIQGNYIVQKPILPTISGNTISIILIATAVLSSLDKRNN